MTTIIYGTNVPDYLAKNTTLKEYFARFPETRASIVVDNEIPNGTLGFNWKPAHSMYMASAGATPGSDDTVTAWFDDKFIGVMPDIDDSWYEFIEGGNLVPRGVSTPQSTIDDMISMCDVVNGMYSFAEMSTNPLSVNAHMGDSFLPVIKTDGVYYKGTCAA